MTVQAPSEVTVVAPTSMPVITVAEEIQAPAGRKNCIISYAVSIEHDVIADSFTPGENCIHRAACKEHKTCLMNC
jgi:hypothetical protein